MDEPTLDQNEIDSLLTEFSDDSAAEAPAAEAPAAEAPAAEPAAEPVAAEPEVSDDDLSSLLTEPAEAPAAAAEAPAAAPAPPADTAALADTSGFPQRNIDVLLDVPLEMVVELGRTEMQVKDVVELAPGSVVELERMTAEPINILVNGKLVARGEVVVVDESFGVRITHIVSPMERLAQLK